MSFPLFLLLSSELRSWDRFEGRFPWPRTGRLTFLEWAEILSLLSTLSKWSFTTCYYGCQTTSCSLYRRIVLPHVTSVELSTEAVWEQKIMPWLFLCLASSFVRIYIRVFPLGAFVHGNLVFLCLPWHIVPFFNPVCPLHHLDPVEMWYLLP